MEKQKLIEEEFKIQKMLKELEIKKKCLENKQNDVIDTNKELQTKKKRLRLKQKEKNWKMSGFAHSNVRIWDFRIFPGKPRAQKNRKFI